MYINYFLLFIFRLNDDQYAFELMHIYHNAFWIDAYIISCMYKKIGNEEYGEVWYSREYGEVLTNPFYIRLLVVYFIGMVQYEAKSLCCVDLLKLPVTEM